MATEHQLQAELPKAERIRNLLDTEDEQLIADMIEGETELLECAGVVVEAIDDTEMLIAGISEYQKTLSERKSRLQSSVARRKGLLLSVMERIGLKKLTLPQATLSARDGRPKVIITDEGSLDSIYQKVTFTPDKTKIAADLNNGVAVDGAELSNAETTLSIRRK